MRKIHCALILLFVFICWNPSVQAQFTNQSFWKKRNAILSISTSAQNVAQGICSEAVTVVTLNTKGIQANVTSNLTVNLAGTNSPTFYSDSTCQTPITTLTIANGTSTNSFYFTGTTAGTTVVVTASAADYISVSQTETISTNNFIWTGGGGNANWATAANWSGGAAPGATQVALFDGTCTVNCSPTIAASINVRGVRTETAYAGTITQASGATITAGVAGWVQNGGTFVGSSTGDAITFNGAFALKAASFTSTSGILSHSSSVTFLAGGTYVHNSGTFKQTAGCCSQPQINIGTSSFHHVIWGGSNVTSHLTGTMSIAGNLTFADTYTPGAGYLQGAGIMEVMGDVTYTNFGGGSATVALVGSGTQTLTNSSASNRLNSLRIASTGTVNLVGDMNWTSNYTFNYVSGTVNAGTYTLTFGGGCGTGTISSSGASSFNNVRFAVTACSGHTFVVSGTLKVAGTLTLDNAGGTNGTINGGTIEVAGDVTVGTFGYHGAGNTEIKLVGTGVQNFSGTTSGYIPSVTFASSGTINMLGTIIISGGSTFTYTSGAVNAGTSKLLFAGGCGTTPINVTAAGAINFYDVTFKQSVCSGQSFSLTGTLNVGRDLVIDIGIGDINGGTLAVKGATAITSMGGGSVQLAFVGTSAQTITQSFANKPAGNITVNNAAGVVLASNVSFNTGTQSINAVTGNISMAGFNLTTKGLTLNGNTVTKGGGVLNVNGTIVGTGNPLYGGIVAP